MKRIALGVEYTGTAYAGWQRQNHAASIQACVESAISRVANEPIQVVCAGRTDAGVHALGQVIHFDTTSDRAAIAWTKGVNTYLPRDIRVVWSCEVPSAFNARKSALSREYVYIIHNRALASGLMPLAKTWIYTPLDAEAMSLAGAFLIGEHDFTSFRSAHCQAKSPMRRVIDFSCHRHGNDIVIRITANAFLHHMVRNVVGTLMQVGRGLAEPIWVETVLSARDRRCAGVTAPPQGLYFYKVNYPEKFKLPTQSDFCLLLQDKSLSY